MKTNHNFGSGEHKDLHTHPQFYRWGGGNTNIVSMIAPRILPTALIGQNWRFSDTWEYNVIQLGTKHEVSLT